MAHMLDFKKICRACLSDAGPLRELFTACSAGVFKYCTSVEVFVRINLKTLVL